MERGTGPVMLTPEIASDEGAATWEVVSGDRAGAVPVGQGEVVIAPAAELASSLPRVVSTERRASWLRAMKRRDGARSVYLLVNEEMSDREETVVFRERGRPKELDPATGEVRALAHERSDGDGAALRLAFARAGSKVIMFDDSRLDVSASVGGRADARLVLDEGWEARRLSEHVIEEDDIRLRAVEEAWRAVSLGDWREYFGDWFSGEAAYRLRFDGGRLPDCDALLIDLGEVCYAAEVRLNGERVGARAWAPFAVRVGREAIREENVLEVRVANTLANVMLNPAVRADWAGREEPGYRNAYDDRAAVFERESAASGLMGPVRVIACG